MKRFTIGMVLALTVAAAGCGGGGGGSKSLTKAEYGSKLNQICKDYNAKVKEIGQPASIEELGTKGGKLLTEFEKAISKAEKLEPPSELKDTADKFIVDARQLTDLLDKLIAAAKANDAATITQIGGKADALSKEGDRLGTELGAPACAEG